MRAISIQVQPGRSPSINMDKVSVAFESIATMGDLVEHHSFDSGEQNGPYFNFTFGTPDALQLWRVIEARVYGDEKLGPHMRKASMVMCSSPSGWNDYLIVFHFDPAVRCDSTSDL
jgi:hypothetical protein